MKELGVQEILELNRSIFEILVGDTPTSNIIGNLNSIVSLGITTLIGFYGFLTTIQPSIGGSLVEVLFLTIFLLNAFTAVVYLFEFVSAKRRLQRNRIATSLALEITQAAIHGASYENALTQAANIGFKINEAQKSDLRIILKLVGLRD